MNVRIINKSTNPLPQYETAGSAGMDLRANLDKPVVFGSLERKLIPTGLFLELPAGFEAQIRPRSGMSLKKGMTLINTPGTIDSDYRGEIKIIMVNLSGENQTVKPGDRIAQMIVSAYENVQLIPVTSLEETRRGQGGFGHTGAD